VQLPVVDGIENSRLPRVAMLEEIDMMPKLVAKLYRMKMMSEVRAFVESLPLDELVEKQMDGCIYAGEGWMNTGSRKFSTQLRIIKENRGVVVQVRSPKAGVSADIPFNTEEERERALEAFSRLLPKYLN